MLQKEDEQGERTECLLETKVERVGIVGGREEEIVGRRGAYSSTEDLYYFQVAAVRERTFPGHHD